MLALSHQLLQDPLQCQGLPPFNTSKLVPFLLLQLLSKALKQVQY